MPSRSFWAVIAGVAVTASLAPAAAASAGSALVPAPRLLRAHAEVGQIRLTWKGVAGALSYRVSSSPKGNGCRSTGLSCNVPATTSTPWRFSVRAELAGGRSARSAWTNALPIRRVMLLAGQSNATGAESYATDPVTHVDYFADGQASDADRKSSLIWPGVPWMVQSFPDVKPLPIRTPQYIADIEHQGTTVRIFGPELGIARQLWEDLSLPVTIVKVALPASLTNGWKGGSDPNDQLNRAATLVQQTMVYEASRGRLPVVSAIFWMQGEGDTNRSAWADAYEDGLRALVNNMRSVVPGAQTTPFVIGRISTTAWWAVQQAAGLCVDACSEQIAADATIRDAEAAVAASVPRAALVETADLPRAGPLLHISNVGELALGRRMATAVEPLLP